jgi:hypothetical protein
MKPLFRAVAGLALGVCALAPASAQAEPPRVPAASAEASEDLSLAVGETLTYSARAVRNYSVAATGIIDEDHQFDGLVLDEHARDAIAKAGALAGDQCRGLAQLRGGGHDVLVQAGEQVAEHGADVAGAIFADDHAFAEDRDATPGLVVAVVADTMVRALRPHQQRAARIGAHELRVARMGHVGDAA